MEVTKDENKLDPARKEVEIKKAQVMEIHDIAMEKMGVMSQLKTELKIKLTDDSIQNISLNTSINELIGADKLMWDWMHGYKGTIVDTSTVEKAMEYLEMQHEKVLIVEEKINTSIKNGKSLL